MLGYLGSVVNDFAQLDDFVLRPCYYTIVLDWWNLNYGFSDGRQSKSATACNFVSGEGLGRYIRVMSLSDADKHE